VGIRVSFGTIPLCARGAAGAEPGPHVEEQLCYAALAELRPAGARRSFFMQPVSLTIDGELGFVFEGKIPETVVFVPLDLVSQAGSSWIIDHTGFYVSGWSEKNMRFSTACEDCDRVFPDETRPVTDQHDQRLVALLDRLKNVYGVAVA
jgi:hypothetical protein